MVLISRTQAKLDAAAAEIEAKYKVKTKTLAVDYAKADSDTYARLKGELATLEVCPHAACMTLPAPTDGFLDFITHTTRPAHLIQAKDMDPSLLLKTAAASRCLARPGRMLRAGRGGGCSVLGQGQRPRFCIAAAGSVHVTQTGRPCASASNGWPGRHVGMLAGAACAPF